MVPPSRAKEKKATKVSCVLPSKVPPVGVKKCILKLRPYSQIGHLVCPGGLVLRSHLRRLGDLCFPSSVA